MKKTVLALAMVMFAMTFSAVASSGEETVIKTLNKSQVKELKANFTEFAEVESMEIVLLKEEKVLKVSGANSAGEHFVQFFNASECGECSVIITGVGKLQGFIIELPSGQAGCIQCEEEYNPGF